MDHKDLAEQILDDSWMCQSIDSRPTTALTHAVLALCERLDELACIVAVPQIEDDD